MTDAPLPRKRLSSWLLDGMQDQTGQHQGPHAREAEHTHPWWRVMCLTGVDYFSSLGYQPGIAALAAGMLSPIATLVLVALTLLGALPVYRRVARESFKGSGSIAMLERLLPFWWGKLFVLVLLGFAVTDFMITITLSAADGAAHFVENPLTPSWLHGMNLPVTLVLILLLGAVFMRGFQEAILIAVVLVGAYLILNLVVVIDGVVHLFSAPDLYTDWWQAMLHQNNGNWVAIVGISLLVFPKLALGMSGFETGVAVMPQITGGRKDTAAHPMGRIKDTRKLLTTAALIMSSFLVISSVICTTLIPPAQFQPGGQANGRALAYLAHAYLGPAFGSVYDVSTIFILWFAGASAMAGLLNVVPRYLPRFGMAPRWAGAVRPLVLVFTCIALGITIFFNANVDAQGNAYATGVLVLMTSAAVAVTISARHHRQKKRTIAFGIISAIFLYTTFVNVVERPDGVRMAGLFILGIIVVSAVSRTRRSFQLRAVSVTLDERATSWVQQDAEDNGTIRIVAHEPDEDTLREYQQKSRDERHYSHIPQRSPIIFLEVLPADPSDFEEDLAVRGIDKFGYRVLQVKSGAVPNTIASVLLEIRDVTGVIPNAYFEWTEGSPISNMGRFLLTGKGEIAPVAREVLREAEKDAKRRPAVHVS